MEEGDSGGHLLRETTTRGLCALVFPSRTCLSLCAIPITKLFLLQTCSRVFYYYLQLLDATSEGTTPTKLKGRLTMARNGLRTRPPGVDPRATDCDGRWIPFTSIHIARLYCSLVRLPNTHSLVLVTAISRMRAGPMVRATFWSSKSPPIAAVGTGSVL